MSTTQDAPRFVGGHRRRSWVVFCALSVLAMGAFVVAALRTGHGEDLGTVVLVGGLLVGIAAAVMGSTESASATSDRYNRRPGVGLFGRDRRGADAGCGGGDMGGC